jgi:hypothetical protein
MQNIEKGTTPLDEHGNPDFKVKHEKIADDKFVDTLSERADALEAIQKQDEKDVESAKERMEKVLDEAGNIEVGKVNKKTLDFATIHAKITLEQELSQLSPIERYYDLLKRLEEAIDASNHYDSEHNMQVQMAIADELQKMDPKNFKHENWVEFYKKLYNKKEEEEKGKGCNYLAEEEEEYIKHINENRGTEMEKRQLNAIQRIRREINDEGKPFGKGPCSNVVSRQPKRSYADFGGEGDDIEEYDEEQLESRRRGFGGVDESKGDAERRCDKDNIAYNHNKRLFYLKMNMGKEEYNKLTKQQKKEKLVELKKTVKKMLEDKLTPKQQEKKLEQLGWKLKVTDKMPFKKNFERRYKEKPSLKDFNDADDVIAEKCPNIFELSNFIPDDPSEMGGHPGAFINIYMPKNPDTGEECQIWGGKKWVKDSRTEYNFYEYLYKNQDIDIFKSFKKYIPLFKDEMGRCLPYQPNSTAKAKKKMHYYIPMNNLHNSVRLGTEEVNNLDMKLGFRTSFVHEKGFDGNLGGLKRDEEQSISSKIGFRLEGSNLKNRINEISHTEPLESGWMPTPVEGELGKFVFKVKPVISKKDLTDEELAEMEEEERLDELSNPRNFGWSLRDVKKLKKKFKLDQYQLYILNPGFIYDTFFYNTSDKYINEFEIKLIEFENDFIKKNFEVFETENSPALAFVGCSIFIVSGSLGIDFKFMDFAHPYVLSWKTKNGVKELSENGEVCCPTIIATGEPLENVNSFNNQLGFKDNYSNQWPLKDDPDDEKHKKDISFDEWSHVFQNWMASLISFVYSFRLWKNSRSNYKTPKAKKINDEKLLKSYNEYNKYFDEKDTREIKEERRKKDPYFWTQDKKQRSWKYLKNKSQSNLMNILLLK